MPIPQPIKPLIGFPTICMDRTPFCNGPLNEAMEVVGRSIWNARQADATDIWPEFFGRNDHQRLTVTAAAALPQRYPTHLGFIYFDAPAELIPSGTDHRPAQFVQQRPSGLIAAQTQYALQTQRTGSVLLTGHMPYRATPQLQGQMAVLENGASRHGGLVFTGGADQTPTPRRPRFSPPALWTDKSVRPTQGRQVGTTLFFGSKPAFHFQKRPRI